MRISKLFLFILLIPLLLISTGCFSLATNKKAAPPSPGGIFKTLNKGINWQKKDLIPTVTGQPGSIVGLDTASLVMDPSDHNTVYFGSVGSGLLYTYDGAETWQHVAVLGASTIRSIAVDPNDKCTIYVTTGNRTLMTGDCSRTWEQIYFDNQANVTVNTVAVDRFNSNFIFIGVSRGDLIKSSDQGKSWQTIHRFASAVRRIIIDPSDSRQMYVFTANNGIQKSENSGTDWTSFSDQFKDTNIGSNLNELVLFADNPDTIFVSSDMGIIKSEDHGATWAKLKLIQPQNQAGVNTIAVNPQDFNEIYYVTNASFFATHDGGDNWTPIPLPTARAGWKLLIDPEQPNVIYLGVRAISQ